MQREGILKTMESMEVGEYHCKMVSVCMCVYTCVCVLCGVSRLMSYSLADPHKLGNMPLGVAGYKHVHIENLFNHLRRMITNDIFMLRKPQLVHSLWRQIPRDHPSLAKEYIKLVPMAIP